MVAARSSPSRGLLVAAEGPDGAGKTATLDALGRWLERQGRRVHHVRWEPSRLVDAALRTPRGRQLVTPLVASLLGAADAYERIDRDVRRPLARGDVVLADRYCWTAVARDAARGVDLRWAARVYRLAPRPDLVVYLREEPSLALARALDGRPAGRATESVGAAYEGFLDRLLASYGRILDDAGLGPWPAATIVLDTTSPVDARHRIVRRRVQALLDGELAPIAGAQAP